MGLINAGAMPTPSGLPQAGFPTASSIAVLSPNFPAQQQHLPVVNFQTVTSGLPLQAAAEEPRTGSLEGAQFVGEEGCCRGVLDSLNSSTAHACRISGTHSLGSSSPATRSIVLTMAPTSAPVSAAPALGHVADDAGRGSERMETVPSAESHDALSPVVRHLRQQHHQEQKQQQQQQSQLQMAGSVGAAMRTRQQAHRSAKDRVPDYSRCLTDELSDEDNGLSDSYTSQDDSLGDSQGEDITRSLDLHSRGTSLRSVDGKHFKNQLSLSHGSSGAEDGQGRRSAGLQKKPRKQLLCEQDPDAPGLTLEQRRKIRR
jgi:hypothetical protein